VRETGGSREISTDIETAIAHAQSGPPNAGKLFLVRRRRRQAAESFEEEHQIMGPPGGMIPVRCDKAIERTDAIRRSHEVHHGQITH
jgi:hypothetical protein